MATISDIHVRLIGIEELDRLLFLIERNLSGLPEEIIKAYSDLVRERAKLKVVK